MEPDTYEHDDESSDPEQPCWECGGDGLVFGEDMGDPLMYDTDGVYTCKNCGGSGLAKDCTYW